jgi:hypothetical protein
MLGLGQVACAPCATEPMSVGRVRLQVSTCMGSFQGPRCCWASCTAGAMCSNASHTPRGNMAVPYIVP